MEDPVIVFNINVKDFQDFEQKTSRRDLYALSLLKYYQCFN